MSERPTLMTDTETNLTTHEVWVQHTEKDKHWYCRRHGVQVPEEAQQYVKEREGNIFKENFKVVKAERSTKYTVLA